MPSITGTVFISDANAAPETDVIVCANDIDLVNKQLLGEVTLQAPFRRSSQTFRIRYSSRQYQSAEGRDIQVQASTLDGLLAGETQIIFNAPDEVTDVRIELRPVENPASEFERLVESLTPLMEGVNPANLTALQIVFLAHDSQERRSRITTWNEAAILTRDTGLPVEAGYGWRRLGQPHTLAGLLEQDESVLRTTLVAAIRGNIIPDITDQIDAILAQLNGLRTRVVHGSFTFDPPSRTTIDTDVIVQAFDRDFRSEELLGETRIAGPFGQPGSSATGRYRIEYAEAQFQQNEAPTAYADIFLRAHTADNRYSAESETHFNAGPEARIDFTLIATETPEVETPDLSELEQLQADLESIRENVPYANFTDDDLQFLVRELHQPDSRVELGTLEQRLDFLRIAARFEQTISAPLAAFFGWFCQSLPTDLAALLDIPTTRLQTALETTIREAVIPDITAEIPEIIEAIRAGRIEQGRLVSHRFVAQLINAQTNRPLGNILAEVTDLDADTVDQDSGVVTLDGQGILVLDFVLPGDAPTDAARRLQLTLRDEDRTLATVEVNAVAEQSEVAEIRVTVEPTAEEQTPISDLASADLTARLGDRGIATIDDLLSNPSVDEDEDDELSRLRDRAKMAVLNPDLTDEQQTYLLEQGLASPQAIARASRAEFVSRHSEGLGGDAAAYAFFKANQDLVKVMHHQIAGNWLEVVTAPGDDDDEPTDIPGGVREIIEAQSNSCGCEDCTSAVSPAAYLAYLLDWTLTHIKYRGATVAFADFVSEFHQPFAGLPTHCDAVTREVRQVRLVVESLWRYIGRRGEDDAQMPTPFRNAYRRLRNQLYKAIVANLGVSFEQLRRATLSIEGEGLTAEQIVEQRAAVASILGVAESVVPELFFNVDDPDINPTEELLEETFGYENTRKQDRFAARSRPQLITWQREKLENQWQIQDWTADDYSSTNRLPYIDPALIDETYLRAPLDTNPAFALLTQRQTLMATHRQGMEESTSTDLAGLDALLESELSQSIDQLQAWFNELQGDGDQSAVTDALATVDALHLTQAGFAHLMTIRSMLADDAALGDTPDEIAAVWNSVFDILSRVHRVQQFATWVEQENDDGIVFGPKLFWPSIEPLSINSWVASEREQSAWLAALDRRGQPPIIDPDQIPQSWVLVLRVVEDFQASQEEQGADNSFWLSTLRVSADIAGDEEESNDDDLVPMGIGRLAIEVPVTAFGLWEARKAFVDERFDYLGEARLGAASSLDAFGALLAASNTGLTLETLAELREQEAAGLDITARLAQFTLERSAYRFLTEIDILTEAGTSIPPDTWDSAEAILVQVEKQREFAEWHNEEQAAEITLHPNQFQLLPPPDAVADNVRSEWLHNPRALNRWVATLKARQDQFETLETALENAVSAAEAQMLTQLRDLLISDSAAPADTDQEKAECLDKRLLMDMSMEGCHMTTRVSQAIETLQRLVRGVYAREHVGTLLEDFDLDAVEDYEAEWPVVGTYASWRAYMLAYLFPENLLHLSRPAFRSHGLRKVSEKLPTRLNENKACQLASEYGEYFQDISNLEVKASCQIEAVLGEGADCQPTSNSLSTFTHLFARSKVSGRVYWSYFDSSTSNVDEMSTWILLGQIGRVDSLLGATPHRTAYGRHFILLFYFTAGVISVRRYDVTEGRWLGVTNLGASPGDGGAVISAAVIQKRQSDDNSISLYDFPTCVGVTLSDGISYVRSLADSGLVWDDEEWVPLYGPKHAQLGSIRGSVKSLVQVDPERYVAIANLSQGLHYKVQRIGLPNRHQYGWRYIENSKDAKGAIVSYNDQRKFYCFLKKKVFNAAQDDATDYRRITLTDPDQEETETFSDIQAFNDNWLVPTLGISLDDDRLFAFDRYDPEYFIPKYQAFVPEPEDAPEGFSPFHSHPVGWNPFEQEGIPTGGRMIGDPSYSGHLLGLVTRSLYAFESPRLELEDAEFDDKFSSDRYFYLFQQKYYGVQTFIEYLRGVERARYADTKLGWWRFADERIRELTTPSLSLAQVIERLLINQLHEERSSYAPPGTGKIDVRLHKDQSDSDTISPRRSLTSRDLGVAQNTCVPGGGSTAILAAQDTRKGYDFPVLIKLRENGNRLSFRKRRLAAPYGSGPFDLLPVGTLDGLQRKRKDIRQTYRRVRNAPVWIKQYLHEAYLHLPVLLGYQLQQSGHYEQALLWYRQVYDYLQDRGKRKIYHYLKVEQSHADESNLSNDYLARPNDVHVIAGTRKNTYTRHIMLLIIRCLIDYADALFARDNMTDNARARELYSQALKFLDYKALKPKKSDCENILGELEIEINGSGQLPLQQFQSVIAEITDPGRLRTTVDNLRAIGWDATSEVEPRMDAMRAAIRSGLSSLRSEAEELPPAKSLSTIVEQDKPQVYTALEAQYLSSGAPRSQFRKASQQRKQTQLTALASLTDTSQDDIPWLRQARPVDETDDELSLAVLQSEVVSRLTELDQIRQTAPLQALVADQFTSFAINTGISFSFCIPQNPVISVLRRRAENNLTKLRTCRNIAGFLRQVDPYGAPITIDSGMVSADGSIFSGVVVEQPTSYRYTILISRAKELVTIAQQIEGGYQSALEAAEREALSVLQAEQNVELAGARVVLQDLRVNQANSQLGLANLQKGSAELRERTFRNWIDAGVNTHEETMLQAYKDAGAAQESAAIARATGQALNALASALPTSPLDAINVPGTVARANLLAGVAASAITEGTYNVQAIKAQTQAQTSSALASFERRNEEWQLQQGLAAQDILIGDQQIQLARDGIAITQQERAIAELEQTHAANILQFLLSKTFTEEMYRWIASVLEDVYRYFLQEAAAIALLAERQLAFERLQGALKLIQSDYWNVPLDGASQSDSTDRLGITGSARLLKDIYRLDQYAFETRQRKQSVSVTLDLAELFPFEFQQFRETGVLVFETPQSMIDQQFPGYYLCLIQQVTVSVVALIPPTYLIRASLSSAGISQTIVGGDTFQTVTLRQLPERLALTSPTTSSGQHLELQPDVQSLQFPFEGTGFATQWQLRMPKASNIFDYNTIATVLFTINFTALHSFDYEQQVIEQLDRNVSANRAFRFRYEFADAWYDLNNPDQTVTPMRVRFETRREDFPPNIDDVHVQHLLLYFIRKDGETFEVPVQRFLFKEERTQGGFGGGAQTIDGVISTRRGNGASWLPVIGKSPFGEWELAFDDALILPNGLRIRELFTEELIEDLLLIITYEGAKPAYP